jgi:hypothetical protein
MQTQRRTDSERARGQGRTTFEVMRCLKRYVAREVYRALPRGRLSR